MLPGSSRMWRGEEAGGSGLGLRNYLKTIVRPVNFTDRRLKALDSCFRRNDGLGFPVRFEIVSKQGALVGLDHLAVPLDAKADYGTDLLVEGLDNCAASHAVYPVGDDTAYRHVSAAGIYLFGERDELHCSATGCVFKQPYLD